MITTILIDDEPLARSLLKEYIAEYPIIQVMQECNDGFEGIKAIMHHRPQLIFLDIQMPKINGFEMLELIEQPPAVIFVTAFDEYAIKAFELHATDYLLKPFSKERFAKAIEKLMKPETESQKPAGAGESQKLAGAGESQKPAGAELLATASLSPQQRQRIVVKTSGKIKIIPVEEIHYLEAADDYVKINMKDGCFLKNRTMSHFENILDNELYVRTHRSYIVNIDQITRIEPYEKDSHLAILKSGHKIPVSKTGYARLRQVLGL